jgi:hypothetical protein
MNIYIDIETIPAQNPAIRQQLEADAMAEKALIKAPANYKDEAKIAEYIAAKSAEIDADIENRWRKTALDGAYGQIVACAMACDDGRIESASDINEREMLDWINNMVAGMTQGDPLPVLQGYQLPVFIGHNITGFDLKFIFQRMVINQIKPHKNIPFHAKPWDNCIYDTMVKWAGVGNRVSLDKLCKVLGGDVKGSEIGEEIDGSKVWDFVKAGRLDDVETYCAGDVSRVRTIHKLMTFQ